MQSKHLLPMILAILLMIVPAALAQNAKHHEGNYDGYDQAISEGLSLNEALVTPPQNLTATAGDEQVTLTWSANPEADLSHYVVYRSLTQGFAPTPEDSIAQVNPPDTRFIDAGVSNWTTYYYRITAVDSTGNASEASAEVVATPGMSEVGAEAGVDDSGNSAGAAWGDYDNDGDLDLYLVNSNNPNRLYRNEGNDTFTEVGSMVGVDDRGWGGGAAWGDYDNDGDLDLYLVNYGNPNRLYRNEGDGSFTEVGNSAGVDDGLGSSVAWGDYDNDGDLDLYLSRREQLNLLYRNNGDGSFTEVGDSAGVADDGLGASVAWGDYDNDGDLDLYLVNYGNPNRLYRNEGDGSFSEVGNSAGVDDSNEGLGAAWGDYDNDGDLDLYLSIKAKSNRLYRNEGNGTFTDVADSTGVADDGMGSSVAWGDYDNDGDLDLYLVNRFTSDRLYRNNGDGTFTDVGSSSAVADTGDGSGAAWGDYDNDGDLDLYLTNSNSPNRLYRNEGTDNRWLVVKTVGARNQSNRDGIGARVIARVGTLRQSREVDGGSGLYSQPSLPVEFGFGAVTIVDSLIIRWPSGVEQVLTDVSTNQILTVKEPDVVAPAVPANLVVTPGDGWVTLTWSANSEADLSHYVVYRSLTQGFAPTPEDSMARVNPPDTSFIDTTFTYGATNYYRITAVDSTGNESAPSPADSAFLAAPFATNLQVTPNPTQGSATVQLLATIADTTGRLISAAEYFLDSTGTDGGGTAMVANDGAFSATSEQVVALVDVSTLDNGSYTLFVHGRNSDGVWGFLFSVTFQVTNAPPKISAIDPTIVPNTGSFTLTVSGQDFLAPVAVSLICSGQPTVVGQEVNVIDATQISAQFTLSAVEVGARSVVVQNSDSQADTLVDGLNVTLPAPSIANITPETGSNADSALSMTITGQSFFAGATVHLAHPTLGERNGTIQTLSAVSITATFDLRGQPGSVWDLVVTNEGGMADTLAGRFTVIEDIPVPPVPPANLSATPGDGQVLLTWSANSEADLSHYTLFRSLSDGFDPTPLDSIARVNRPDSSYTDSGLIAGATYYYRLVAEDESGNRSEPSAQVGATVLLVQAPVPPDSDVTIGDPAGGPVVDIPAGAVASEATMQIIPVSDAPELPGDIDSIGQTYAFKATDNATQTPVTTFDDTITIRLPYTDDDLDGRVTEPKNLRLYRAPTANDNWEELADAEVDTAKREVSVKRTSLSLYQIGVVIESDPPTLTDLVPAPGDTSVVRTSAIQIRLQDSGAGIDSSTLVLKVNDQQVPGTDYTLSGKRDTYLLSHVPAMSFNFGQTVTVRVTARDLAGTPNSVDSTYSFRIEADVTAPTVNLLATGTADQDSAYPVRAIIRDNDRVVGARLFYRKGGVQSFSDSKEMQPATADTFTASIPGEVVTSAGIEFFVHATDASNNLVFSDTTALQVSITSLSSGSFFSSTAADTGDTAKADFKAAQKRHFRMISIPIHPADSTVQNVLGEQLGIGNFKVGRIFRWNGSRYDEATSQTMEPGKAFWVISKIAVSASNPITVGSGKSSQTIPARQTDIFSDFTQIGVPYAFPVPYDTIRALNSTLASRAWWWNGSGYDEITTQQLDPWKGYWVHNTGTPTTITIPAVDARVTSKPAVPLARPAETNDWTLQISVEAGEMSDWYNYLGISSEASETWDRLDFVEPPPLGAGTVALYFPHGDWPEQAGYYAGDFRPSDATGHNWDFTVEALVVKQTVHLRVLDVERIPALQQVVLFQLDPYHEIDLREQALLTFPSGKGGTVRQFKLVVGSMAYLEKVKVTMLPKSFALLPNYPNPFNPATTIRFNLPRAVPVRLAVYNVLGQEVKILLDQSMAAGYHRIVWDGTDKRGHRMASGVYFFTIRAGTFHQVRKMLLLH